MYQIAFAHAIQNRKNSPGPEPISEASRVKKVCINYWAWPNTNGYSVKFSMWWVWAIFIPHYNCVYTHHFIPGDKANLYLTRAVFVHVNTCVGPGPIVSMHLFSPTVINCMCKHNQG